jgi:hypothetical protein
MLPDRLFLSVERARAAFSEFKKEIAPNLKEFILSVCRDILELSQEGDDVETARVLLEGYHKRFQSWTDRIRSEYDTVLSIAGVGYPLDHLDGMLKQIKAAIEMIEDLDTHLMESFDAFGSALERSELLVFH